MSRTTEQASRDCDFPDYCSITKDFYNRRLDTQHPELDKVLSKILLANTDVAEELMMRRQSKLAAKLGTCHRVLRAHKIDEAFETTKYCRLPLLCAHCAELQAIKRAQEVMMACHLFSKRIKHSKLRMNQYLIKPDMRASLLRPSQSFLLAFEVIKEFRELLSSAHAARSGRNHEGRLSNADKKKLLGPTVIAIHVVPIGGGAKHYNEHNQIHLHLTIVTTDRVSQRYVTSLVTSLWVRALTYAGVVRQPEKNEINPRREYRHDYEKCPDQIELEAHGYRDKEFVVNRFAKPDDASPMQKASQDYRGDELSAGATLAFSHLWYLSKFRKDRWEPVTIADHYFLVTDTMKLQPKQLRQFLGHEGVTARQLPDEFNPNRYEHRFLAKLVDVHAPQPWRILQRVTYR